jgi:molecular chaperone DnaJ
VNPYEVLQLNQNASIQDVERAYKKLAFQFHPDRNIGDAESEKKFRQVQEAYDRIKNPEKFREQVNFDQGFESPFDIIFPFFSEDPNININISVSVKEAYFGINKTISVPRKIICSSCQGSKFSQTTVCPTCQGSGAMRRQNFSVRCKDCFGKGRLGTVKCETCHFTGQIKQNAELTITLPAGLRDNSVLRLQGAGNQIQNFVGDVLLKVKITPFGKYFLNNDELCVNIELPFSTFVGGGEVEISDLENETFVVKILPQTPTGTKLRVKNKGMKMTGLDQRSDLVAIINIIVPNITDVNIVNQLKNLGF